MTAPDGGFEDVREKRDGHAMWQLFRYASRYRWRLLAGVGLVLVMRVALLEYPPSWSPTRSSS